jgi:hypothetical protein
VVRLVSVLFAGPALVNLSAHFLLAVETGTTDSTPATIAALVIQLGLSGVFLWLYMGERNQRMKRDDQLVELASSTATTIEKCTTVLQSVERGMAAQVERVSYVPDRNDWDLAQRAMHLVIDELRDELHRAQEDRRDAIRKLTA